MQGRPFVLNYDETDLCDDVLLLRNALQQINSFNVQHSTFKVQLYNCGTAMRFLTAYCAVQDGLDITLTGSERMQERPIGQLVDALRNVGADIEYLGSEGYPPLRIHGKVLPRIPITLNDVDSSQFISALMLVGFPVETNETSPYIEMTQELIEQVQKGEPISIERDWSSASYWYEYVALYGGEIIFLDLYFQTLQGDSAVAEIFESLGVKSEETDEGIRIYKDVNATQHPPVETPFMASPIDTTPSLPRWEESEGAVLRINFSSCPDLYPAVYVTCHQLGIPLKAHGTERLLHKESNRLQAFDQLNNLTAKGEQRKALLHTYSDHRIAMSLLTAGYQVDDIACISKSYPQFVEQLRNITYVIPHRSQEPRTKNQNSHIIHVSDEGRGKKWALLKGIEQATTEYVWLTDNDVTREHYPIFVPPTLLGDLTILPLRMELPNDERRTANGTFQITEYQALQSLTIWAAERGHAVMCSGANMIVNRQRWIESYKDLHAEIPSGDDMFLLESFKRRNLQVKALYQPEYIATIQPEPTWKAFFRQRMRWAGKATKYTDRDILLCGSITVLANLLILLCPPLVLLKYPFDMYFLRKAQQYNITTTHLSLSTALWALLLAIVYPWYMFICLIGGLIRQHTW